MKIFAHREDTSKDLAIDQLSQAKNCILFYPSLIKSWMELVISQKKSMMPPHNRFSLLLVCSRQSPTFKNKYDEMNFVKKRCNALEGCQFPSFTAETSLPGDRILNIDECVMKCS